MNLLIILLAIFSEKSISLTSPVFANNGDIPIKYTCQGPGTSPPLVIGKLPEGTVSLALTVDDPDAPNGGYDHWVVWNIDPATTTIEEGSKPGTEGKNGSGEDGYKVPCPPTGKHHYHFKIYALDTKLKLDGTATKAQLQAAIKGHILGHGELIGLYQKQ